MSDEISTSAHIRMMHDDIVDMKAVLKDLTKAVNHMAVVDVIIKNLGSSVDKLQNEVSALKKEVQALQMQSPSSRKTTVWVDRITWISVALVGAMIGKKLGLI